MSHDDQDIQRLLRAARRAGPDDEVLARVWRRLGAPPPIDPGPDDGVDVPDPAALAANTNTIAGKLAFAGGLKAIAATVVLAGAVIGGARWIGEPAQEHVSREEPTPTTIAAPEPPPGELRPPATVAATGPEPGPRRPRARKSDVPAGDALAEERRLIAEAQAALQRGDLAGAHARLDEHARRFAQGVLSDEREVLRVLLLCDQDRRPEALAAAQALLAARGAGLFLPRLRGACIGEQLVPVQRPRSGTP